MQKMELIEIMEKMFELLKKTIPILKKNKLNLYEQCLLQNFVTEFVGISKKLSNLI